MPNEQDYSQQVLEAFVQSLEFPNPKGTLSSQSKVVESVSLSSTGQLLLVVWRKEGESATHEESFDISRFAGEEPLPSPDVVANFIMTTFLY
jgi:hypothetical protein